MSSQNHHRCAHQLPEELWEMIIKTHLDSRLDVYSFRAVCRSWLSLLPLSLLQASLSPLYLPHVFVSEPPYPFPCYLCPLTICRLEPINPPPSSPTLACLTRVEESTQGQLQLLIPLSNEHLKTHQKTLNMLDFRLVQLGKSYSLKSQSGSPLDGISKTLMLNKDGKFDVGLEILCLYGKGKLGFWRFGDSDWTRLDQENTPYEDIILYKGQIYVVDKRGIVWWLNSKTLKLIMYSPPLYMGWQKKHLVESEGHLYLVDMKLTGFMKRVTEMRVYKLDEEWGTWVHVPCLGDRLVILAKDYCFSTCAASLCGSAARNCIFFTDSYDEDRVTKGLSGYHTRVFSPDDRRTRMVARFSDHICTFSPPLAWLISSNGRMHESNSLDVKSSELCL